MTLTEWAGGQNIGMVKDLRDVMLSNMVLLIMVQMSLLLPSPSQVQNMAIQAAGLSEH
jgi:hypothetical protein